jgi:hypothetical protein
MMKTYTYFISILLALSWSQISGQKTAELPDTVEIPLKIRVGIEVAGPVIYFTDKNNLSYEGYLSADLNEKTAVYLGGGYSDYKYSQYNYNFLSNGLFIKAGADFNLLKPEKSEGKYWAGIGLHYGLSSFSTEVPVFSHENYWGIASSSAGSKRSTGHFIEFAPGFRAEIFNSFTIGWSLSIKKLISSGTGKDLRPVYFPGYGTGGKSFSTGINYFLILNFTYKKIRVEIKPEPVEEPEE